ncbi:cytochrome P450 [Halenospora varia]|nr:cytochrome P450 [Halenospora varia]
MMDISIELTNTRAALLTLFLGYWIYIYVRDWRQDNIDNAYAQEHGCKAAQCTLPYRWPLGLDIMKAQYDALVSGHLLAGQIEWWDADGMGKTFRVKLLGAVGYVTHDPQNLETILSTRFEDYTVGARREGLFPMIGEGIFTQDGNPWKHSRELLRRQFARIQYQDLKAFDGPINDLLGGLRRSSGIVDLQPLFFAFTQATTTSLLFGEPFTGFDPADHEIFSEEFKYCSLISTLRLRLGDFYWLYSPWKFKKSCDNIKSYASCYVDHALRDQQENGEEMAFERHPFILDLYKELQDPVLVRDQLMNVLLAGRDTTACLMSWCFYLLVRNPASLQRLRQEIFSVANKGEDLTRAQISKMTWLKCILNETNRLYTQIPVNSRAAVKNTVLPKGGGPDGLSPLFIKKGVGIVFSPYHMHRHKELYGEDAGEFRPERWERPEMKNIGWRFMPFHGGPRTCLGKDFALAEASYGIVRILQSFPNLALPLGVIVEKPGKETQDFTIVVSSREGCKVMLN